MVAFSAQLSESLLILLILPLRLSEILREVVKVLLVAVEVPYFFTHSKRYGLLSRLVSI